MRRLVSYSTLVLMPHNAPLKTHSPNKLGDALRLPWMQPGRFLSLKCFYKSRCLLRLGGILVEILIFLFYSDECSDKIGAEQNVRLKITALLGKAGIKLG